MSYLRMRDTLRTKPRAAPGAPHVDTPPVDTPPDMHAAGEPVPRVATVAVRAKRPPLDAAGADGPLRGEQTRSGTLHRPGHGV